MVQRNMVVQRHIEQRFFFAMVFVGQFAVLELHRLALGQKRDRHRVFAGSFHCCRSPALRLFFFHTDSPALYFSASFVFRERRTANDEWLPHSNSALATGCGASGPSPISASAIVLPFSAVETAVSIISSARRIVPWLSASMDLRIA